MDAQAKLFQTLADVSDIPNRANSAPGLPLFNSRVTVETQRSRYAETREILFIRPSDLFVCAGPPPHDSGGRDERSADQRSPGFFQWTRGALRPDGAQLEGEPPHRPHLESKFR